MFWYFLIFQSHVFIWFIIFHSSQPWLMRYPLMGYPSLTIDCNCPQPCMDARPSPHPLLISHVPVYDHLSQRPIYDFGWCLLTLKTWWGFHGFSSNLEFFSMYFKTFACRSSKCWRGSTLSKTCQSWKSSTTMARMARSGRTPVPRVPLTQDLEMSHHACLRFVTYLIKCGDVVQICPDSFSCHSQCPGETSAVLRCQDLEQGQQNLEDIQPSAPPAPLWVPMMPEEAGHFWTPMPKQVLKKQQLKQVLKYASLWNSLKVACHLKKSSESPHAHSMSAC